MTYLCMDGLLDLVSYCGIMDVQIDEPFDVYPFMDILSNTNAF